MEKLSSISIFGFFANWSPFFLVAIIFSTIVYFLITTKWRHDIPNNRPLKQSEIVMFILSMVLLYICKGSPIDLLSHIIFSFHMLQMAVLYLLVVPMLYFAIPPYLIDYVTNLPIIKPVFDFFKRPVLAIILFNGIFSVYHLPAVLDYLKQNATLHSLFTILLFVAAVMMWYPIFNRSEKEAKQLTGLQKLLFIFMIGVLLTPSCGLIIFAQTPMYKTYTDSAAWMGAMSLCVPTSTLNDIFSTSAISGPQYFTDMTPLHDQQTGGVIMKIMQEIFFAFYLLYVFIMWRQSERMDPDEITRLSLEQKQKENEYFNQYR